MSKYHKNNEITFTLSNNDQCNRMRNRIYACGLLWLTVTAISCKPVARKFDDTENAVTYTAATYKIPVTPSGSLKVMSWNIRFGIGRQSWFGDACGDNTLFAQENVTPHLDSICMKINEVDPGILYVQECDVNSKRTSYINEVQYILDHTSFNFAYYGPMWQVQFIPSHGLGKMDMGVVIFSKWPLTDVKRIQMPLRTDQGAAEKYFYLRYCMLHGKLDLPGYKTTDIINVHAVAFASDDTKKRSYERLKQEMDDVNSKGGYFIAGGDLNTLPPGATKTDYCLEDMCPGETFHTAGADPQHKEGSDYSGEPDWISPIFNSYTPSLSQTRYMANEQAYYTHTTRPGHTWDRRLDHLFTNYQWIPGTDSTHQEAQTLSDHAPISVSYKLPQ